MQILHNKFSAYLLIKSWLALSITGVCLKTNNNNANPASFKAV